MNVLVTGCVGFIGSHVTEALLERGDTVVGIDCFDDFYDPNIKHRNIFESMQNPNFTLYTNDITGYIEHIFRYHDIDVICHLAARAGVRPSIQDPKLYQINNVIGTTNLLEAASKFEIDRFVFASSSSVYGDAADEYEYLVEGHEMADFPISPYAASKRSCELIGHTYFHLYKMSFTSLRFFTVYGPRQRPEMAIHKFARNIMDGKKIYAFGDGTSSRDYTYISDCVNGILAAIDETDEDSAQYRTYNIGGIGRVELKDLIDIISREVGKKPIVEWISEQPGDVKHTVADISEAHQLLQYNPQVSIDDGIKAFIKWMNSQVH